MPLPVSFPRFAFLSFSAFGLLVLPLTGAVSDQLLLLSPSRLAEVKDAYQEEGDAAFAGGLDGLLGKADAFLDHPGFTVVKKEIVPASGDKHDYFSMGPYWWPNPETEDGLPYVRRDGQVNPERDRISDRDTLHGVCEAVQTLALAYTITEEERYGRKAAELVRVFFLDPETRMNPNLRHAQAIPGVTDGRGVGLIDARVFTKLVDALELLRSSPDWSENEHEAMVVWFREYTEFLLEHPNGVDERERPNNHGTAYDLQAGACLLFIDNAERARELFTEISKERLPVQITENGRQPLELDRTKSWNYVWENMTNWFRLATLAQEAGVDLWQAENAALRRAIEELLRWNGREDLEEAWPWEQILPFESAEKAYVLEVGRVVYPELFESGESARSKPDLMTYLQLPEKPARGK